MKTSEAIAALHALNAIATRQLPLKFAYAAARNRRKLVELNQVFESSRQMLLQQHGQKDEAGALVIVDENVQLLDVAAFTAAFNALCETEVDPELHRVALDDFPKDIELGVMEALFCMVAD